jgi:hypothetical protein
VDPSIINPMESLNHPIAIVAIMAAIVVMIREVFFFIRHLKKDDSRETNRLLRDAVDQWSRNLERLTELTEESHRHINRLHDKVDNSIVIAHEVRRDVGQVIEEVKRKGWRR